MAGPSVAYPLWVVTRTCIQSRQSYTAHYCRVLVACWHQLVRPIGWPHQTAAWAAVLSSRPWRGWWASTTSKCQHWTGWVTHHPLVGWQWGHPLGYAAMKTASTACRRVCPPESWSTMASLIGRPHVIIAWLHAYPTCLTWEQSPSQLQPSPWRMDPSWGIDQTIVPFSGWFDWVDGAISQSVTVVDLLLSTVLQFPGDFPSALALVSMGIWQMSPLGEATQCSRLAPRLCFSSWFCPLWFCSAPPPSLNKRWGLIVNDLAIVPSSSFLEPQYYWSSKCRLRDPVLCAAVS